MDDKFKERYRVKTTRMSGWDYGSNALYYITICTKDRLNYFGEIIEKENLAFFKTTPIGEAAFNNWRAITEHFPFIELDEFVIMPNHLHGILFINKPEKVDWQVNKFGVQSQNLASVIRGYKASVKTFATKNNIEFNWQPRYYDRVIIDEKEYLNVCTYIENNPTQWLLNGESNNDFFEL